MFYNEFANTPPWLSWTDIPEVVKYSNELKFLISGLLCIPLPA